MQSTKRIIYSFSKDYKLILITVFLMRIGQFMLLPFLAIYLIKHYHISPADIGIIVGTGPLIYGMVSIFSGIVVDKIGVKPTIIVSLLIGAFTIFFFFKISSFYWFFLMNVLTGITRSLFDVSSKSYGITSLSHEERKVFFGLRFISVNSAAAIGPIIGDYFAAYNSLVAFKIGGVFYLLLGIMSIWTLRNTNKMECFTKIDGHTFFNVKKTIMKNHALQLLVLASFIIWIVYSQLDSTLPQYLYATLKNGVHIYALLLIFNALGCTLLQIFISHLSAYYKEMTLIYLSLFLFAIGYVLFGLCLNIYLLFLAMMAIVIAESILVPLNDSLLAKISPPEKMGTYYGIMSTAMLGLGIGPMLGGGIYGYFNQRVLFLSCGFICFAIIPLYKLLIYFMKIQNPNG